METIFNDLCQHSLLESPDWHKTVLKSREQLHAEGNQVPLDWEEAKQQIRNTTMCQGSYRKSPMGKR